MNDKEAFLASRRGKVDINEMDEAEFTRLMERLGSRLRKVVDDACEESNGFLAPYNLKVKMALVLQTLDGQEFGKIVGNPNITEENVNHG